MNAIAGGIFAGGVVAASGGLLHDRFNIYVGLAVMVAFVWADWYDQRQQRRRAQKQVEQERRQQKRNGRG